MFNLDYGLIRTMKPEIEEESCESEEETETDDEERFQK